jgi:hypothetical protein
MVANVYRYLPIIRIAKIDLSGTGTEITATPCYYPGTRILTDRGEIRVEQLKISDLVQTISGALRPIK